MTIPIEVSLIPVKLHVHSFIHSFSKNSLSRCPVPGGRVWPWKNSAPVFRELAGWLVGEPDK